MEHKEVKETDGKKFTIQEAMKRAQAKIDSMSPEERKISDEERMALKTYPILLCRPANDPLDPEEVKRIVQRLSSQKQGKSAFATANER